MFAESSSKHEAGNLILDIESLTKHSDKCFES